MLRSQPVPRPPQVAIYCRVSTEEQKRRQSPIQTQLEVCYAECRRQFDAGAFAAQEYVDEGFSGTLGRVEADGNGRGRPAYSQMLQEIATGQLTHVVVQDLDRLARDELEVARHQVLVVTPGRTFDPAVPDDRMMIGMRAVMSAHQPRQTAVKVKQGLAHRARCGYPPTSRVGYGWRSQRRDEYAEGEKRGIEPVPEEGRWVVAIKDLYLRGWGVSKITRHLNEVRAPAPLGNRTWTTYAVRRILFSPVHAGLVSIPNPEEGEARHARGAHFDKRYYDPETFQAILERKTRASRRRNPGVSRGYFLSGALRCAECGRALVAATHAFARYYQCPRGWANGSPDCRGVMLRAEEVEPAALQYLRTVVDTPEFASLSRGELEALLGSDEANVDARLCEIEKQQRVLERQLDWLVEQTATQPGLRSRFHRKCEAWQEQHAALQQEAERLRHRLTQRDRRAQEAERVRELLAGFDVVWAALDHDERREMANLLLETAVVQRGEGEAIVQFKAPFLPGQESRFSARQWSKRPNGGPLSLTPRECEALFLRGEGLSLSQIAERWGTGSTAPAVCSSRALRKLGVKTVYDALDLCGDRIRRIAQSLPSDRRTGGRRANDELTPRERQLVQLIAGTPSSYAQIAGQSGLRPATVYSRVCMIARKLGVRGRAAIAACASRVEAEERVTASAAGT